MLIKAAKFVINVVPEAMANSITRSLAAMTQRPPISSFEREAMAQANRMSYGESNVAWVWGNGPLVMFVHGWSGRAAQMAPLALHVANLGFRSVAIDVTGHGDSPKRHTRWDYFFRDIAVLSQSLHEEVYAYVGHSAGALSMMAARALKGIHAQRYACICAPSFPFPPINVIQKKVCWNITKTISPSSSRPPGRNFGLVVLMPMRDPIRCCSTMRRTGLLITAKATKYKHSALVLRWSRLVRTAIRRFSRPPSSPRPWGRSCKKKG